MCAVGDRPRRATVEGLLATMATLGCIGGANGSLGTPRWERRRGARLPQRGEAHRDGVHSCGYGMPFISLASATGTGCGIGIAAANPWRWRQLPAQSPVAACRSATAWVASATIPNAMVCGQERPMRQPAGTRRRASAC